MRLWSIHPKYYDDSALARCIGEGLGGLRALCGLQKMHRNHPQLERFKGMGRAKRHLSDYILHTKVFADIRKKIYGYDYSLLVEYAVNGVMQIPVTTGQIEYECGLLLAKMINRNKGGKATKYIKLLQDDINNNCVKLHQLFYSIPGDIESWEKIK